MLSVEQVKHVTAIEVNLRMAAEVMKRVQGVYVFTLIFNFSTPIATDVLLLSSFLHPFSLTPFRFDLSGFLSSNADRLTVNSTS